MAIVHGAGGHAEVDFNLVASRHREGVVEFKYCELCGCQFFRSADALHLQKYCAGCNRKLKSAAFSTGVE